MSETFLRLYRQRVESALKPHRDIYGEESPVVRMGERLLAEAEDVQRSITEEMVTTAEAVRLTGWNADTLQQHAKAALSGATLPARWRNLMVEKDGQGYRFLLSSIPDNPRSGD